MKKINKKYTSPTIFVAISMFFLLFSCQKDEIIVNNDALVFSNQLTQRSSIDEVNKMNRSMERFALLLAKTLDNRNVRASLKEEALKKFDGDFDILYQKFASKQLNEGSFMKVLARSDKNSTTRGQELLNRIAEEIPLLNIAIPVNIEKWDVANFKPLVAVRGVDFDDATTKKIRAYDSDGNIHVLDATIPPDFPVIVVGLNERLISVDKSSADNNKLCQPIRIEAYHSNERYDFYKSSDYYEVIAKCGGGGWWDNKPPATPTNLKAITTESGIRLIWDMPSSSNSSNTTGYYIYRKKAGSPFTKVATIYGIYNKAYDDIYVDENTSYTYYVVAYFVDKSSSPSNYVTITAPNFPKAVTSFTATQNTKTEIELRWTYDITQNVDFVKLKRKVIGEDGVYVQIGSFGSDTHEWFDTDIIPGKKHEYKVEITSSYLTSNPRYNFIKVPYRDISENSPVYIKALKYTNPSLEKWPAGSPEFYIKVMNVDPKNGKAFIVQDQVIVDFPSFFGTWVKEYPFPGKKVINWAPGFWYDMLSFSVVEYDKSFGKITIGMGVGYHYKSDTTKVPKNNKLFNSSINYEYTIKDKGENCGVGYLNYFEEPDKWIEFPGYGVELLVGEKDWGED